MFLKIMSGEDVPDSDTRKSFQLFDHVESADFVREDGKPQVHVVFDDAPDETFDLLGNCYLMNDGGKTVASFGPATPERRAA